MLATVHRRALLLTIALLSGLLLCVADARAAGSPDISATISSQEVLHGRNVPVEVTAHNPTGQPYAYNLSYRVVLPAGVSFAGGSPAPTTTIAGPGAGERTLIFRNVSDLSPNSTHRLSFTLDYDEAVHDVGDTFDVVAQAFVNGNERYIPRFDAAGQPVGPAADSYTGYAGPVTGTTRIEALDIEKDEPSPEGEILRGVHDHQTVYTLTVENNDVRATDGVTVVDHLPAGLEFIGCGGPGTDNTRNAPTYPGTAFEYPGAGAITSTALAPCVAPLSVETVNVDPDGAGPLPLDVYTRVTWNVGTLAARERRQLRYRAAIPIRENTMAWTGATPATTGAQAANLDNNSGAETRDEQELTNYATAAGRYNGVLNVDDEALLTRTAEDWRLRKSADTGVLVQDGLTWWTLTLDTSEYRSVRDATVTDTLPSGLCPLGSINYTGSADRDDVDECGPTGDLPTVPYLDADENADGTWTLSWDSSVMPALGQTDVSDRLEIRFPTRTRTHYQANFGPTTPILTRDRVENRVTTDATAIVRCRLPGTPDCTTPGPEIDHDAGYATGTRVPDASQAAQEAGSPSIDKRVAAGPGPSCVNPFTDAVPTYHPGDTVCWKLRIDFPGAVDTSPQVIGDFMPPGARYVPGSDAAFGDNNVTASLVDTDPADDVLQWTITGLGGTVPRGGRVFERTIQTVVEPPAVVNGEVLGNLMKFSSTNTPGVSEPLRDQVDIRLVTPVMALSKGVYRIERAGTQVQGPFDPALDGRNVQAGDAVTYSVVVRNTGGQDAVDVEVWDLLPRQFGCLTPGVSNISNGGVCSDETLTSDRIKWTVPSIPAGGQVTLRYTANVALDANPVDRFENTAGVRQFEGETNTGGRYVYTPANNIDPRNATTPNAPRADDPSIVTTNDATIAKTRTTSRTETGNAAANQATIGERIAYAVTATIPAGTTLGGTAAIADVLDSTTRQLVDRASVTATLDGGALPGGFVLGWDGTVPTVTFPADFVAPPGQPDRVLVLRFDVVVADVPGNSRTAGDLTNRATLRWTDPDEGARTRTSSTLTTQIVEPLLSQAKADDAPGNVIPGDIVRYTVTTTNGAGSPGRVSPAHDVSIVDVVPVGLTPVEDAPGNAPVADGATVPGTGGAVWNLAARTITKTGVTIQPGANHAFSYRARVDDPAIGGAILRNRVTSRTTSLTTPDPDGQRRTTGTGYEASADDTIRIQGASVTKSVDRDRATVGEHVTYELLVTIPADISLYDVTVADVLPNAMAFDAYGAVSCVSGCAGFPRVQSYDPVTAGDGTTTLGWDLGDIVTPLDDPLVVRVLYTAHVRETTAGSATRVVAGARAVNAVTVGSNRSDRGAFDRTRRPTTFEDESSPARATVTVVEPSVGIDKTVSVDGGAFVDGPATAQSDDGLTYRLVVRNTGDAPAHDVVVDDMPDAELTDVRPMAPLPAGVTETKAWSAADRRISWLIRRIDAGASVTLTYDARLVAASGLSDGQAIDNTAAVPSYWGVPVAERSDPQNATVDYREYRDGGDDSTRVVLDFPTLTLTKTTGLSGFPETGGAQVGNAYPWRVTVRNTSATATASDVIVSDVLPPNWEYDAASATLTPGGRSEPTVAADAAGDRLGWTVASLAPGATVTIDYTATPAAEAADDPGLGPQANVNTARVSAARDEAGNTGNAGGPYETGPDDATATLSVPQLRIAKTPDGGSAVAGTASSFTVRVENIGAVDATDLVVEDVLPDGLTYTAGDATAAPATGFSERSATAGPGAGQTTIVWDLALLRAGESVAITVPVGVEADVPEGATLENVASVRSAEAPTPIRDRGSLLVDARADMAIEKTGPATYVAGEGYTWRLRVRNLGPSDAQGVVVSDPLPAGTRFVSADAPCVFAAGEVRCAIGTAPVGFDRTYEVTVDVEPATDDDPLVNEAAVTTTTEDVNPANDRDDHEATPDPIADVTVVKTATPTAIARGGVATFAIEVVNRGPSVARDVELSDPLPAGLDFVSADHAGCTFGAGEVRCLLGDLAVDAPVTVNVAVRGTANGSFTNVATVTTTTPQPPGGGEPDSDDATVEVGPVADLGIVKSGPATILAGGQLTWKLEITNHGEDPATGVTVTDPLPQGVTFVSASDGCTVADGTVTCAIGALAVDETVTRQIRVSVPHALGSATIVNTAAVDGDQIDENPSNDRDDAITEVGPSTDLQLVKSGPATAAAGGQVAWTLVVTNNGPSAASGVSVADELPQGVAFVSATPAQGTCAPAGQLVSCALGALPSGGSTQVQVVGRLDVGEGTTVVNVATVRGEQPDPNPSNDRSEAPVRAGPPAEQPFDLALTKRVADGARPAVGDRFAYELTVVNRGPGAARGVVVTDTLPRQVAGLSAGAQGGRCGIRKGVVRCALGDMAAGERRTVTVRVRALTAGNAIRNSAIVSSSTADADPSNDRDAATVRIDSGETTLRIAKRTLGSGRASPGGVVRFRVTVKNTGRNAAAGVTVCDRLPEQLSLVKTGGGRLRRGDLCWTVGVLPAGKARSFVVATRVNRDARTGTVRNRAWVQAENAARRSARAGVRVSAPRGGSLPSFGRGGGVTG